MRGIPAPCDRRSNRLGRSAQSVTAPGNRAAIVLAAVLATAVLSCARPPDPLAGHWVSVGSEGSTRTSHVFEEDGRAQWILQLSEDTDTFKVAYEVRYDTTPIQLDMGPWGAGPLAGQTLYGIVELQGPDRFRVDFEPADPGGDGSERPIGFSEQAMTFVRKVN